MCYKEIGLICNLEDRYAPTNPNVIGGGHACQDIYAGNYIYEPESVLKTCKDGTLAMSCGVIGYGWVSIHSNLIWSCHTRWFQAAMMTLTDLDRGTKRSELE